MSSICSTRGALTAMVASALLLSACSGGSSNVVGHVNATPSPGATATAPASATPTPFPSAGLSAYECPTSLGTAAPALARSLRSGGLRRFAPRRPSESVAATGLVAVSYARPYASAAHADITARETRLGATFVREYEFAHAGISTRVLSLDPARVTGFLSAMRASPGVRAAGPTGQKRYPASVTSPYFTSDPYFTGFSSTIPPVSGATPPPPTFEAGPLEENSGVPGQWDMHAIALEHAFAYSQPANGSGVSSPGALGSSSVKVAIIDTGEDATHPELAKKIVYQRCFITAPGGTQSVSDFADDPDGHGTDVAGLAAADTGNGFGFAGAGGNAVLYGYRVFPEPTDACATPGGSNPQCYTNSHDIVAALEDAVAAHVNVINLSLVGGACSAPGTDPDPLEGAAIADAIAANVIVVAAAGNQTKSGTRAALQAPACDSGVIAVGATGLADGQPNGAGNSSGSAANPIEYVASYSNAGSPGAAAGSASAWGIVAPGGDPSAYDGNGSLGDALHWIVNIWTSTPYQSSPTDQSFVGSCVDDYPSTATTPPVDCQVGIAGTSMSSPHVAGAAALILAVNPAYQNPAAMKQLLCSTADDIGDPAEGCGRLNVYRAMAAALNDPNPPPPAPQP